jgi:hypothetical protein
MIKIIYIYKMNTMLKSGGYTSVFGWIGDTL